MHSSAVASNKGEECCLSSAHEFELVQTDAIRGNVYRVLRNTSILIKDKNGLLAENYFGLDDDRNGLKNETVLRRSILCRQN